MSTAVDASLPSSDIDPATEKQCSPPMGNLPKIFGDAAIYWYGFGFKVIPLAPLSKISAVTWDRWLVELSDASIRTHWATYQNYEVGFIVGDEYIVFDTDSPESHAALFSIEQGFGVFPDMVVKTNKGTHHYFRRAKGTVARSDSHSTEKYPDRIDVKTGRALVVAPPSSGKSLSLLQAENAGELVEIDQDFIDAVFKHNGRSPPRAIENAPEPTSLQLPQERVAIHVKALLDRLDPDAGYEDWLHVLMAVFHETGGSDEGFALVDAWSKRGSKYKGVGDIKTKWHSFRLGTKNPITIATLKKMVDDKGLDANEIVAAAEAEAEPFPCYPDEPSVTEDVVARKRSNPLDKHSLNGMSGEIERNAVAAVPVLGSVALKGQMTVFYAAPNTGKTLLTLALLTEACRSGLVEPAQVVYYLNVDDTSAGLVEKLQLAEEYGFHMLAEGYQDFRANLFPGAVKEMIERGQASGIVIILDTLKRFVDLMDKTKSSAFTKMLRNFALQGGTVIALAHTNKRLKPDGKLEYGGVSDIINDFDCAYILSSMPAKSGNAEKIVEFENIKRRGNVVQQTAYRYSVKDGISYSELLASVQPFDNAGLAPLKQAQELQSDSAVIAVVEACITKGITSKMRLADEVKKRSGCSKQLAITIIQKYTGDDLDQHRWKFTVQERGAKVYSLLPARTVAQSVRPTTT